MNRSYALWCLVAIPVTWVLLAAVLVPAMDLAGDHQTLLGLPGYILPLPLTAAAVPAIRLGGDD